MHGIGNFHGKKITTNTAFFHIPGTVVADVNGARHLLITGEIDFISTVLTQDYCILMKIAKKKYEIVNN